MVKYAPVVQSVNRVFANVPTTHCQIPTAYVKLISLTQESVSALVEVRQHSVAHTRFERLPTYAYMQCSPTPRVILPSSLVGEFCVESTVCSGQSICLNGRCRCPPGTMQTGPTCVPLTGKTRQIIKCMIQFLKTHTKRWLIANLCV